MTVQMQLSACANRFVRIARAVRLGALTAAAVSTSVLLSAGTAHAQTQTMSFTTATTGTTFIVPTGVTSIQIELWGGGGGGGAAIYGNGGNGGGGGFATGTFDVTAGQMLTLLVGGGGGGSDTGTGGANGGGDSFGAAGGGYSAVYLGSVDPANLLALAGGGGAGGAGLFSDGGLGSAGGSADPGTDGALGGTGGGAGTDSSGGVGGTGNFATGTDGAAYQGGGVTDNNMGSGGGGGGGYYGGGQGGVQSGDGGSTGGGGGGGSSYSSSSSGSSLIAGEGPDAGADTNPDYISGVGVGGTGGIDSSFTYTDGTAGGDGEVFLRYTASGVGAGAAPEPGSVALLALSGLPVAGMIARRRQQ